jgi:hypothetical protein
MTRPAVSGRRSPSGPFLKLLTLAHKKCIDPTLQGAPRL